MEMPVRVLHVIAGLGSGGAESFIMNMYRNIDHTKVQFDFALRSNTHIYERELLDSGSCIFKTASFPKHIVKNRHQMRNIFVENNYSIVHVHGNALLYMEAIKEAKRAEVPCRIMHSHNSSMAFMTLKKLHEHNKKSIKKYATDCFACSEDAGKWMFGDGFTVINNAVDLQKFCFFEQSRNEIRKEFAIPQDSKVIVNVGRLTEQKNQKFLIDVFNEIAKNEPNSRLIVVGKGEDESDLRNKVNQLNLGEKVIFTGTRKDVERIISAGDAFVFPSIYEGLPVTIIEAQANGIPVFCSEAVPKNALVASNAERLSLELGTKCWAERITESQLLRHDNYKLLADAGYDIRQEARKLQEFYLSQVKE